MSSPGPDTPWREAGFCVVDLETTGLDPDHDEIISFAALHIDGGRVRLDDALYRLVRPERMPRRDTILIHGLRSAELLDAPSLSESLEELLEALAGRALVAHVASVEVGFLGAALHGTGRRLDNPVIDTDPLAAELFRGRGERPPRPYPLGALAEALALPVHRPHEADGDALTTAQVFIALATHLDRASPQTVGSLERISGRGSGTMGLLARLRAWL
jgi:DNA polymerase III subunit epsilon